MSHWPTIPAVPWHQIANQRGAGGKPPALIVTMPPMPPSVRALLSGQLPQDPRKPPALLWTNQPDSSDSDSGPKRFEPQVAFDAFCKRRGLTPEQGMRSLQTKQVMTARQKSTTGKVVVLLLWNHDDTLGFCYLSRENASKTARSLRKAVQTLRPEKAKKFREFREGMFGDLIPRL
jgi:hypothetical protein